MHLTGVFNFFYVFNALAIHTHGIAQIISNSFILGIVCIVCIVCISFIGAFLHSDNRAFPH